MARLDRTLGLNRPLVVQYWNWLTQAAHGNLGRSYFTQIPVAQSICPAAAGGSVDRAAGRACWPSLIGGTAGTVAAVRRGGWFDRVVTMVCSAVSTLPAFVVGIVLVVLFSMTVHLLPANGYVGPSTSIPQWLAHIILPALALALAVSADIARQLRTSLVEVLEQNYIVGARVRGLPHRRVLFRHALRNASGPALTILGNDFPLMLAGAVAAEAVFSLPGLGQLLLESAQTRDIPVVQGAAAGGQLLRHRGQPDREHHAQLALPDQRRDGHVSGRRSAGRGRVAAAACPRSGSPSPSWPAWRP